MNNHFIHKNYMGTHRLVSKNNMKLSNRITHNLITKDKLITRVSCNTR